MKQRDAGGAAEQSKKTSGFVEVIGVVCFGASLERCLGWRGLAVVDSFVYIHLNIPKNERGCNFGELGGMVKPILAHPHSGV